MLIMLFGTVGLFNACDLDDGQNFRFTTLSIVDANLPESFELNETYSIEVTYEDLTAVHFLRDLMWPELPRPIGTW